MHVPTKDDGAETKTVGGDGQELLLGHELTAENAIDVDAGDLDFGVMLEDVGKVVEGDLGRI